MVAAWTGNPNKFDDCPTAVRMQRGLSCLLFCHPQPSIENSVHWVLDVLS